MQSSEMPDPEEVARRFRKKRRHEKPYEVWSRFSYLKREGEWSRWGRYRTEEEAEVVLRQLQRKYGQHGQFKIKSR